jgi:phospholipase/carboxylesterase
MDQTDLSVSAEIKLYYDMYVPSDLPTPAPLLIAAHGYGAHKRYMMREAKLVGGDRYVIASIQAPHPHYRKTESGYRIGYGWLGGDEYSEDHIGLHHRFVLDLVDRLSAKGLVDADRIVMYGFSQACALNFRFAFTYPEVLSGIIGVCGGIPGDLDQNRRYQPFDASTMYLYGDDDEFYSAEQFLEYDARLKATLPNYRSKRYAAKHEITAEMRQDISGFLLASMTAKA